MDSSTIQWAKHTLQRCVDKYTWVADNNQDKLPYTLKDNGQYDNKADRSIGWNADDGLNWWTNGFWAGILWHLFVHTKNVRFAQMASVSEALLDQCFVDFYGLHHDVGFMWIPTSVYSHQFTGNPASRRRALHAASLLAGRYNAVGKYIRAWNDIPGSEQDTRGWAIIDCMLNIPLLHWASKETGDPRYRHIALVHANTVIENFIRPDGSCEHIVEFDCTHGRKNCIHGGQGYAPGSAWTRGQAWALYGFAVNHRMSGQKVFLDTAQRVADYFIAHIPSTGLIPIDFNQPAQPALEDSCGAAIAACGLLELVKLASDERKQQYEDAAVKILTALDGKRCEYGSDCEAIVSHCSGAYHTPSSHHIFMVYADYFYFEALTKITAEDDRFIW